MKSVSALCIVLFSLLLFVNLICARKDVGDYWKKMTENQPMPQAIKDLIVQDPPSVISEAEMKKDRFVRDFDVRPNAIIYHTHEEPQKKMPSVHNFEQTITKG